MALLQQPRPVLPQLVLLDFSARCFRVIINPEYILGYEMVAQPLSNPRAHLLFLEHIGAKVFVLMTNNKSSDSLTEVLVWDADYGHFGDVRMRE